MLVALISCWYLGLCGIEDCAVLVALDCNMQNTRRKFIRNEEDNDLGCICSRRDGVYENRHTQFWTFDPENGCMTS